jgi:CBS domain containing-hemolysin-like protein
MLAIAALLFGLAVISFSLREFSRSRLEDLCQSRGNPERFGQILLAHQRVLLVVEISLFILLVLAAWSAASHSYFASFRVPDTGGIGDRILWLLRIVGSLGLATTIAVLLPWTVARVQGEWILYRTWPLLSIVYSVSTPVWAFAGQVDRLMHRVFGVPEPDSAAAASLLTDELRTVVDESQREGVIQSNASTMIHRVVDLHTEDVASIMTPRTDIVTIPASTTIRQAIDFVVSEGYSRVPVIRERVDDIVGILYARDLLACAVDDSAEAAERTVETIVREVLYAPESQGIDDLLDAMRQKKVHMAIIVDEYSGVSGLVTLEDILEEIVGEIADEYDEDQQSMVTRHQDGRIEVDARLHIDDLNDEFNLQIPEDEEFDTIGGFLLSRFGRIPVNGETYQWEALTLTVLEADERRLIRIRIDVDSEQPHVAVQKHG